MSESEGAIFAIRHMALRNAKYHTARRRRLDGLNRFFNLVTILGGTAVVANVISDYPGASKFLGFFIAFVGAVQLVVDFGGRARTHQELQRAYNYLLAEVDGTACPDDDTCAKWRSEIVRISADAPPVLRVLDAIADNEATAALCGSVKPRLRIPWYRRLLAQVWAADGFIPEINQGWAGIEAPYESSSSERAEVQ